MTLVSTLRGFVVLLSEEWRGTGVGEEETLVSGLILEVNWEEASPRDPPP